MNKLKTNIIGGFLGSGKTTLLRHFLSQPRVTEKVAVLVNELGEVGIDGRVLNRPGMKMMELTNGCVCCQVTGDMIQAVKDIRSQYAPERLLIETTGVAEPGKVLTVLYSPYLAEEVRVEPTIVVVDVAGFERLYRELAYHYVMQIKAADVIILNKTDLVSPGMADAVEEQVRELNPRAFCVKAVHSRVDLLGLLEGRAGGVPEGQQEHEEVFASFVEETDGLVDRPRLGKFFEKLTPDCYRAKGFVKTREGWFLVNYVTGQTEWESWPAADAPEKSRLVFIGRRLNRAKISRDLKRSIGAAPRRRKTNGKDRRKVVKKR